VRAVCILDLGGLLLLRVCAVDLELGTANSVPFRMCCAVLCCAVVVLLLQEPTDSRRVQKANSRWRRFCLGVTVLIQGSGSLQGKEQREVLMEDV
jgi:hypothetical protein